MLSGPKEEMMSDTRTTKLEVEVAHLARTVDELNEVVTTQADEIEILTRRVRMMMERLAEEDVASGSAAPLADQRPPHW